MEENWNQNTAAQKTYAGRPQQNAGQSHKKFGISGSSLKLIAVITMIIDHTAAGILGRYLSISGLGSLDGGNMDAISQWMTQNAQLYNIYYIMRMIGRIAFPIYCFLLVEGFEHTRNRTKYAVRLLLFAAVSELPFDLLFNAKILEFGYQNVFFTLFIGLAVMMGIQWVQEHMGSRQVPRFLLSLAVIAAGMAAADFAKTDYAATGVLCIVVIFLFRGKKVWQIVAGCLVFLWELTAPLAFVPIGFYNGRRGWNLKYFFYLVYPVHLLLLYLLCMGLGIASYPAM